MKKLEKNEKLQKKKKKKYTVNYYCYNVQCI